MHRAWLPACAVTLSIVLACLLVLSGITNEMPPVEELGLGLAAIGFGAALAIRYLVLPSHLPAALNRRVAIAPLLILGVATSFFSNGVGPVLAHQAAWGIIGVAALLVLTARARFAGVVPAWLIAFVALELTLQLVTGDGPPAILDIGIVGIALFVSWNIAAGVRNDGSVARFLGYVAALYWLVTAVGLVVATTNISLGSMSPSTVTLPWAAGFNGNYQGYGFVSTQVGRMLTAVICVHHMVRWRYAPTHKPLNALLCLLAAVLFLFEYGRIPLIGGILAIAIALTTMSPGTRFVARICILLVVASVATAGLLSEGADSGALSLRIGTANWDSGHLALWNQQLRLFTIAPLAGVSSHPTDRQLYEASLDSIIPVQAIENSSGSIGLTQADLVARGSRGEGGWTGLLAQHGIVGSSILLALLLVAARGLFRSHSDLGYPSRQDAILLRAILPATFVWYLTDIQVAGFTTFTGYVVLQLTMFGVVMELRRRSGKGGRWATEPSAVAESSFDPNTTRRPPVRSLPSARSYFQ